MEVEVGGWSMDGVTLSEGRGMGMQIGRECELARFFLGALSVGRPESNCF